MICRFVRTVMLLPRRRIQHPATAHRVTVVALIILAAAMAVSAGVAAGAGAGAGGDDATAGGPLIVDASYRLHAVEVLNTRHDHGDADKQYTDQHGGDTSIWSYDTAVVSVSFDDALYLNSTSILDVLHFVSLAPANRQILYGLTRLVCPALAAGGDGSDGRFHRERIVESYPVDPKQAMQEAITAGRRAANANDTAADGGSDGDVSASIAAAVGDAYDAQRSLLHQSGSMLWPLASSQWSPFTWLHTLADEQSVSAAGSGGGGYHAYNRLEWAVLLGYTTPAGDRHTFIDASQLPHCRIDFLPKHKQTSDWWAAQVLSNRAGDAVTDSAVLTPSHFAPKHHHVVSQHADDVSFLEERTEVGTAADAMSESGVGIPGLSVLISALVDEILGPDVKRVADFVTVRLDYRLLGLLAKYVGGTEIPGVYKLWNLLEVDQKVTPYQPNTRSHATADAPTNDDSDGDSDADGDFAGWDREEENILLDLSAPPTAAADPHVATAPTLDSVSSKLGLITTGRRGEPLTAVQQKAAQRMASPLNPLNLMRTGGRTAAVDTSLAETGASTKAGSKSGILERMSTSDRQTLRALAKRYKKWHSHTSLPAAFVPRFPQVSEQSRMLSHSGTRASMSVHSRTRELDEPDGIMTRNIITALAKLLTVTVSVALTETLTEALNEDMRDLILPPLREYLPVRMTPIVTRGLVQPLVISLTETITNGVERVVPAVVLSRLKHTLIHTLTRGVTHALAPTLMYTLRDASHLEPVCYSCYYVDRSYCDMCSYLRRRQDRLAPAYHDLYFVDYFTSFYTDHYADWFTYGINPKDPAGTFVDS